VLVLALNERYTDEHVAFVVDGLQSAVDAIQAEEAA
jgi:hypothetical protein